MIELLAPAGGMPQLKAALRFGADAVYGGLKQFGLRSFAGNFTPEELQQATDLLHKQGKKFYVTLNILPFEDELNLLSQTAKIALDCGADGAIVSDLGAFARLSKDVPGLPLHVSTQANVLNAQAARIFISLGAKRIVPARELSLERVKALREKIPPDVEIECFVHGAMCMSYSGRCMLSDHMTGRRSNRGECAQPCRWHYTVVEEKRPGEYIPVESDERGTALFSAYDLCMLEYLPQMKEAGISSLKIEGRMKTAYYVASVVSVYRRALDLLEQKGEDAYRQALPGLIRDIQKASHRPSNTGFYFGAPRPAFGADGFEQTMEYIADVEGWQDGKALLRLKNRFFVGDEIEFLTPGGSRTLTVSDIILEGQSVNTVSVAGQALAVPCPFQVHPGDFVRGENRNHRG